MRPRSSERVLLLGVLLIGLPGCALPSLIHDKMLGPVSPAGEVHPATVGGQFTVTNEGVQSSLTPGQSILRPYPPNWMRRIAHPESFWFIMKGLQAAVAGFSPIVHRTDAVGRVLQPGDVHWLKPATEEQRDDGVTAAGLRHQTPENPYWERVGVRHERRAIRRARRAAKRAARPTSTLSDALRMLGTPDVWLRREGGTVLAYRAELKESLSLYAGVPPLVSNFIPIPLINNLQFRYTGIDQEIHKTILFFGPDDRLQHLFSNAGRKRAE